MPRPRKNQRSTEGESDSDVTRALAPMGVQRGHGVCPDTERLLEDGSPHPQWVWRNLCDLQKSCPREEYVQSPVVPTASELAEKWGVGERRIESWMHTQRWPVLRKLEWEKISDSGWKEEAQALVTLQKTEILGQRERWIKLRTFLEQILAKGTITEQTAMGDIYERTLNPKDVKDVTAALQTCDENISRTIGFNRQSLQRQALAETSNEAPVTSRVVKVRHNFSVVEEVETPALPPPAQDAIEGVVVE